MEIQGGCLCGAVRYSAQAEPAFVIVCHCRDCQKFTGSAFATLVGVPKSALSFEGDPKTFTATADSGRPIGRQFCPHCGSSLCEISASRPDLLILNAGTLDDPISVPPPVREIYCDRAFPWVKLDGICSAFRRCPPESRLSGSRRRRGIPKC